MSGQESHEHLTILSTKDPTLLERQKVLYSAILSGLAVFLLWLIKILEWNLGTNFRFLANLPRNLNHIQGIITEPLVHGDFEHLISNSVPLFLFLWATLYFYRNIAGKVIIMIWIFTGLGVWLFARANYHIGASGVIYGLAAFHAFSGILRRDIRLMAISLLVVFLYGGMFWGVFPVFYKMSWESHLMGAITGIFIAILFRKSGPPKPIYFSDEGSDDEDTDASDEETEQETPDNASLNSPHSNSIKVTYRYVETKNSKGTG